MMWILTVAGRQQIEIRNRELDREAERRRVLFASAGRGVRSGVSSPLGAWFLSLRGTAERAVQAVRALFRAPAEPECC